LTTDEALKLALHGLEMGVTLIEDFGSKEQLNTQHKAIAAIYEALARPEQEPVGRFAKFTDGIWREVTEGSAGAPLYTTPPQRTWVNLTNEEIGEIYRVGWAANMELARAIEAKLREKNT
jgi:hypothetical protein